MQERFVRQNLMRARRPVDPAEPHGSRWARGFVCLYVCVLIGRAHSNSRG